MHRADLENLLLDCLRVDGKSLPADRVRAPGPAGWAEIAAMARATGVAPLLYHHLRGKGLESAVPAETIAELRLAYFATAIRNGRLFEELEGLIEGFAAGGVPVLVLKGPILATNTYPNQAVRVMADIDLLVPEGDIGKAADLLESLSYRPLRDYRIDLTVPLLMKLPDYVRKGAVASVDLHANLTTPGEGTPFDMDELWSRSGPVTLAGFEARALSLEDMLLHLAVHVSHHHRFHFGLRPFCDIAAMVLRHGEGLDWDAVAERAVRWQCRRGVWLTLQMASEWLGAEVPSGVLERLKPADADASIVAVARARVLAVSDQAMLSTLTGPVARVLDSHRLGEMVRTLAARIFVSKQELGTEYNVDPSSPRIYFYYFARLARLARRYAPLVGELLRHPGAVLAPAHGAATMDRWLESA